MIVFIVRLREESDRFVGVVEQPRPGDGAGARTPFASADELVSFMETSLRDVMEGRGELAGGA